MRPFAPGMAQLATRPDCKGFDAVMLENGTSMSPQPSASTRQFEAELQQLRHDMQRERRRRKKVERQLRQVIEQERLSWGGSPTRENGKEFNDSAWKPPKTGKMLMALDKHGGGTREALTHGLQWPVQPWQQV